MITPSGFAGRAQAITGIYEKMFVEGGKALAGSKEYNVRPCSCSAPVLPTTPNGEKLNACLKGESCFHVAGHLLFVLAARGWNYDQALDLVRSMGYVGLAYLYADESNFGRMWKFAQETAKSAKTKSRIKKKRIYTKSAALRPVVSKNFKFEIRYEIIDRFCTILEQHPGINKKALARLTTNSGFNKSHYLIYLKHLINTGVITVIKGYNGQDHLFLVCRPEPPKSREFRDRFSYETDFKYYSLAARHYRNQPRWVQKYEESLQTKQQRAEYHALVASTLQYSDFDSNMSSQETSMLLDYLLNDKQFSYDYAMS